MLQLRDADESGPAGGPGSPGSPGAATLVPGGAGPPFEPAVPPARQTLRPLSVRTAGRAGRLRQYFVFRVRAGRGAGRPRARPARPDR